MFTSDVNDGKIGINATAGDVKVDIVDISDNPQTLVGDVLNFQTSSNKKEILFEPGATYYTEGFRVKNLGNIPINFILYVSEDGKTSKDFADAFDVWITTNPDDIQNAEKLREFSGRLEVGQSSGAYYLVFKMKETAGNEFQDRSFTGVGITVNAVQGNVNLG
ncbi:MAG: hypothetical protein E7381_02045 [Clostridiales bacterium]|nr:hypothetical protein [Clostridiales bacterium]